MKLKQNRGAIEIFICDIKRKKRKIVLRGENDEYEKKGPVF